MATKVFLRSLTKFLLVNVIVVVMANVAAAYTIVFRSGLHLEVPETFEVGTATVTYELAPGINKTLQLALIDIAATEAANLETPGGFFNHSPQPAIASPAPPIQRASRTLTNADLEPIRQRRIESEKGYEKRRIELGLPTVEESRRRQAAGEEGMLALARQRATEDAGKQAYWRNRASTLRGDFASVDAQVDYLRSRSAENQSPISNYGAYPNVYGGYPNVDEYPNNGSYPRVYGRYDPYERYRSRNSRTYAAPQRGALNQAQNRGLITRGSGRLRTQAPTRRRSRFGAQLISPYTDPFQPPVYGNSYYQDDRLDNLLMRRAELEAQWRTLENEARNARVPQAWLLP